MSSVEASHNPGQQRYEAHVDGELAGFAQYILTPELIVFTHTEVAPEHEGLGVGSTIARFALDDVREGGALRVLPTCPFIKGWIARHREYVPLVYGVPATTAKD